MRAYSLGEGEGKSFETVDISAGGTYLSGDPEVAKNTVIWLRLELVSFRDGKEWVYPLDAEVDVVRVTRDPEQGPVGFACRWVSIVSHGDIRPIQEFLHRVLNISSGFVEVLSPRDEGSSQSYAFAFPDSGLAKEGPAPDAKDGEDTEEAEEDEAAEEDATDPDGSISKGDGEEPEEGATIIENPAAFLDGSEQAPHPKRTGIYVVLPITYSFDNGNFEGRAIKLHPHGMRISTNGDLPNAYQRIEVSIMIRRHDKQDKLKLTSTVTTVRQSAGEGDGQFEVEFSLGNDPDALEMYRRILDKLVHSLAESSGV